MRRVIFKDSFLWDIWTCLVGLLLPYAVLWSCLVPGRLHLWPVFGGRLLLLAQCYSIIKFLRAFACAVDAALVCILQCLLYCSTPCYVLSSVLLTCSLWRLPRLWFSLLDICRALLLVLGPVMRPGVFPTNLLGFHQRACKLDLVT